MRESEVRDEFCFQQKLMLLKIFVVCVVMKNDNINNYYPGHQW